MMQRIPVWLDCDPGHDDAMAIILSGYNPNLHLLGVSTIGGNQVLHKVTQNALDVLQATGLSNIDVVKGQHKPVLRSQMLCPEIHGDTGLDGPEKGKSLFPRSSKSPLSGKAIYVMHDVISNVYQASGEKVRLVCTGPLTNAALLLSVYPELIEMLELVFMGGAIGVGNTGPVVEFNMQVDPEAAKIVFESGVSLTMVPLEVTHTVLVTPKVLSAISGESPTPFRMAIQQLLLYFASSYASVFNFEHPPLHDPAAVAYVIAPELFQSQEMRVDMEVVSPLSAGQTVCDVWRRSKLPPNCRVCTAVNVDEFWKIMIAAVSSADLRSPLNDIVMNG